MTLQCFKVFLHIKHFLYPFSGIASTTNIFSLDIDLRQHHPSNMYTCLHNVFVNASTYNYFFKKLSLSSYMYNLSCHALIESLLPPLPSRSVFSNFFFPGDFFFFPKKKVLVIKLHCGPRDVGNSYRSSTCL